MKPSERLLKRIEKDTGICLPEGTFIRRTRAGRHQLDAGGWSWYASYPNGTIMFGSSWTVTELMKAPRLKAAQYWMGTGDFSG